MYSKEQLEALSWKTCGDCPNEINVCDVADDGVCENLAQQCLVEMKTRESVERKLKIVKTALHIANLYCEGYENE